MIFDKFLGRHVVDGLEIYEGAGSRIFYRGIDICPSCGRPM